MTQLAERVLALDEISTLFAETIISAEAVIQQYIAYVVKPLHDYARLHIAAGTPLESNGSQSPPKQGRYICVCPQRSTTTCKVEKHSRTCAKFFVIASMLDCIPNDYRHMVRRIEAEWAFISMLQGSVAFNQPLLVVAYSMLLCVIPFQVNVNPDVCSLIIDHGIRSIHSVLLDNSSSNKLYSVSHFQDCISRGITHYDAIKGYHGAHIKVNFSAEEALIGVRHVFGQTMFEFVQLRLCALHRLGFYNDQLSNVVMYGIAVMHTFGVTSFDIAALALIKPRFVKAVNCVIKSTGLSATSRGAMLCELQCLHGRGVDVLDIAKEMSNRGDASWAQEANVAIDQDALREAINTIYDEELTNDCGVIEAETTHCMVTRRWAWFSNGGHSITHEELALNKHVSKLRNNLIMKPCRRAFAESLPAESLEKWSGKTYVSGSLKLEQGKTRLLLAGDSITYIAFEQLLATVEKHWAGKTVILNPGNYGQVGMHDRILRASCGTSVNVGLDYDDFNSQHSLASIKSVFHCLRGRVRNVDFDLLCNSFDNTVYIAEKKKEVHIRGGLCSGHRGTTFINSVLNRAYLCAFIKRFEKHRAMHVGDDVYVSVYDLHDAADVMARLLLSPLRLNTVKQSVGLYSSEFLRVAYGKTEAYGYIARVISSVVSGNWINTTRVDESDALHDFVGTCWSIRNRSQNIAACTLLASIVSRKYGRNFDIINDILCGSAALDDGPIRDDKRTRITYSRVINKVVVETTEHDYSDIGTYATDEYLANHVTPIEAVALASCAHTCHSRMLESSYSKSINMSVDSVRLLGDLAARYHDTHGRSGCADIGECYRQSCTGKQARDTETGVLCKYPLIMLIKNSLSRKVVQILLRMAGIYKVIPPDELNKVAFGNYDNGVVVGPGITYNDAYMMSKKTQCMYLNAKYRIYY